MGKLYAPKDQLIGQVVAGEFTVEEPIGVGGMGTVYRATQALTQRPVALKVLHRHLINDIMLKRFEQEARAISRLNHPNIVVVYKYGQHEDGALYMAMEYIEGRSLAETILATGAISLERSLPLMIQMADALGYAHDQKIIHRDIKPENIVLTKPGRHERVKLLDFGIAKLLDDDFIRTQTGQVYGSPPYMAPEQWLQDRDIDGRVDLYALGCVYYRMLSGRLPFSGKSTPAVMHAHLHSDPPPLLGTVADLEVCPELDHIIRQCIQRNKEDRYPDAFALLDALKDTQIRLEASRRLGVDTGPRTAPAAAAAAPRPSHPAVQVGPAQPVGQRTHPGPSEPVPRYPTSPGDAQPTLGQPITPHPPAPTAGEPFRVPTGDAVVATGETGGYRRKGVSLPVTAGIVGGLILAFVATIALLWSLSGPGDQPQPEASTAGDRKATIASGEEQLSGKDRSETDISDVLPASPATAVVTGVDVVAPGRVPDVGVASVPAASRPVVAAVLADDTGASAGEQAEADTAEGPTAQEPADTESQAAASVKIQVQSRPGGAMLYVDGNKIGAAPQEIVLAAADKPKKIMARKRGYRSATRRVAYDQAGRLKEGRLLIVLKKKVRRPKAERPKTERISW